MNPLAALTCLATTATACRASRASRAARDICQYKAVAGVRRPLGSTCSWRRFTYGGKLAGGWRAGGTRCLAGTRCIGGALG